MDSILFFTTMHKAGWDLYGSDWIRSLIRNVLPNEHITARIYCDGFTPPVLNHPRIEWLDFHEEIPQFSSWRDDYTKNSTAQDGEKKLAVSFAHKAFLVQHILDTASHDYLVWTDGDVIFKLDDYTGFPSFLQDKFAAVQVEPNHTDRNDGLNHIESGILIFDNNHPDTVKFNTEFKNNYTVYEMNKLDAPFDGYIIYKSICEFDFVDLNEDVDTDEIVGRPDLTFLHPEIQRKFIHNIGWDGKIKYTNWKQAVASDEIYSGMENHMVNIEGRTY